MNHVTVSDKKNIPYKEFKEKINKLPFQDDTPISIEFLDNSYYGREMALKASDSYKCGFNDGVKERVQNREGIAKAGMTGVVKDLNKIYPKLLDIKKDIYYAGYGLEDAGYHGWYGEPLQNLHRIIDKQETMIDECISICQIALDIGLDKNAWDKL